jgi:hypothetical protein
MIKRWVIHTEFHWGYWPRFSIKRLRRAGERVSDGGQMGTLVVCPECSGEGLLHRLDEQKFMAAPPLPWAPDIATLDIDAKEERNVGDVVIQYGWNYRINAIGSSVDRSKKTLYLRKME